MNIGLIGSENTVGLVRELVEGHTEDYRKVKIHLHACQSTDAIEALLFRTIALGTLLFLQIL